MRNGRDSELTSFYQGVEKKRDIVGGFFSCRFFGSESNRRIPRSDLKSTIGSFIHTLNMESNLLFEAVF